ncbi:hypothetical protein SLEP1_g47402 [Rubroshorea leprosula]|uniref:Leucine-rich repeat-containing N-terminal plant-type domain-containing protein n=1 Tax=Rubroshorea leprosula TaxID=152421 RepID=A0AAV5LQF6_9ROSI|nr:hypothetical protein SLEP1_g47402 [Rubroshorea leprosula]
MILLHMQTSIGFNSTTADNEVRCIKSERQALLTFKQGLVDKYGWLSSWGNEEEKKECCKWEGVQCSNTTGHVTVLNIPTDHSEITGNFGASLFELQHLISLGLSSIDFNLSHIPESIGLLNKIQHLDLYSCNLSGPLPSQLANLTSLQFLDLGSNNFNSVENLEWLTSLSYLKYLGLSRINQVTNCLLQVMNKLPHLIELHLDRCNLQDVVPQCVPMINTSTSLAVLHLESNNLSDSTFQWLFEFNQSLVDLSLSNNQFQGLIPENLGHMTYLESLTLSHSQFGKGIPKSFGNLCKLRYLGIYGNNLDGMLPELIGNLTGCLQLSLESLNLGGNKIKGPLPDMIENFSSLRELYLYNNQLSGTVSKSIGLLSELEQLHISSNSLNGTITESHFSTLSKLQSLDMSFNPLSFNFSRDWIPPFQLYFIGLRSCKLGPKFPNWLKTQKDFSSLDISGNQISDSIPKWFWNVSSTADELNLSSNQIYGIVPDLSTNFANSLGLRIDLSKNKLQGSLPVFPADVSSINLSKNRFFGSISYLCTVTRRKLQLLDVSYNQLSGKLPGCMTGWTNLRILNLANNHLFGKIPSSIGSLSYLESLGLQNNNFSGEIPWSLGNCSALQFLDLSYNRFSGIIPAWVGERLSSLIFLLLRSNNFSGDIPLQLCRLTNIMLLDLSNNHLSGSIPWCIQNLTALAQKKSSDYNLFLIYGAIASYVDKAAIMWKGMVYDYEYLKDLRIIDLSSNKLTGEIPVQISSLFQLVQLNLSRNQLTGKMPPDIGQLRQLESLDLSSNQLSGHVPGSMSQLNFLSTLNLSHNNFSGRIPLSTQMQSFNASAFVGNAALCGLPLTPTCPGDEKAKSKPTDSGGKDNQEDRAEFWKSFKLSMELGVAISFVGVLAVKLDHPLKHLCFLLFNNVRVHLSTLKDCLYVLVAVFGLVVREHVSRLAKKLKLFEPSVSS